MAAIEETANRVRESIALGVISILFIAFSRVFASLESVGPENSEFTISFFQTLFQSAPGLISLGSIIFAFVVAGSPRVIGAIIEILGVDLLLNPNSNGGFGLIVFGALIVTIFSFDPWTRVYVEILS